MAQLLKKILIMVSSGLGVIVDKIFISCNIYSDYNLCAGVNENLTITLASIHNLSALVEKLVAGGLTSTNNLCALASSNLVVSPTSTYTLSVA